MLLYERHKVSLRKLVEASAKSQSRIFWVINNSMTSAAIFGMDGGGERVDVPMERGALSELENTDYLDWVSKDARRLTDVALLAVESNFAPPKPPAPTTVNNTITIHGSVTGGTIAQGKDVTIHTTDAARLLKEIRDLAGDAPDLLEQVDNIADELASKQPLARRLKSFIAAAHAQAIKNAPLASAISALATAVGLAAWFQQHVAK